ncbi:hypothetical protein [Pedobacter polysacchareus]|uniref:hypothetical protein n=1 Tax=Pedobacter polysacchareus TaxID=2861973 RepID=UPI001C98E8D9|nr:hypothetical protein [Pedobacter polysacchareus]
MAQWYTRVSNGNPNSLSDYVPSGGTPPACPGKGKICAIFAEDGPNNRPIITEELQQEMITALNGCTDTQNVLLRSAN